MYDLQDRIYCGKCNISCIAEVYPNRLKSQCHIKIVSKSQRTITMIVKTHFIENK